MIVCCERNPCPYRPRWFLSRFTYRPWRCAQCGRLWVTRPRYLRRRKRVEERFCWGDFDGYEWHDITPTEARRS